MYHRSGEIAATFSIVARDPQTGFLGAAVASRYLAIGAVVPLLCQGVGAINIQHWHNPDLARRGLLLLETGLDPDTVLRMLLAGDNHAPLRQVLILDARGRAAATTGKACTPPHRTAVGDDCVAGGNALASETVVDAMVEAFVRHPDEPLGMRLLHALRAGEAAGGDYRGRQSAVLRTVSPRGVPWSHACVDLRVDDHPDPINELFRLYYLRPEPR